jgi:hypothetical protein
MRSCMPGTDLLFERSCEFGKSVAAEMHLRSKEETVSEALDRAARKLYKLSTSSECY